MSPGRTASRAVSTGLIFPTIASVGKAFTLLSPLTVRALAPETEPG